MEKLKEMAKTLDKFAKWILFFNIFAAGVIVLAWIAMLGEILLDKNALREYLVMNFGSVKVESLRNMHLLCNIRICVSYRTLLQ